MKSDVQEAGSGKGLATSSGSGTSPATLSAGTSPATLSAGVEARRLQGTVRNDAPIEIAVGDQTDARLVGEIQAPSQLVTLASHKQQQRVIQALDKSEMGREMLERGEFTLASDSFCEAALIFEECGCSDRAAKALEMRRRAESAIRAMRWQRHGERLMEVRKWKSRRYTLN